MNVEIKIENQSSREMKVIYVPITLPKTDLRDTARYFMKLGIHTHQTGGQATGIAFIRYLAERENEIDLEVCLELEEWVAETDEIKAKIIPAWEGAFMIARHTGSRSELPAVYEKMLAYGKESGTAFKDDVKIDFYLNTAHQVPESQLITHVFWPVK